MNDLESRLRQSLGDIGNTGPRSMPGGTQGRIRARRAGKTIAGIATLAAFVLGVGLMVPRGTQGEGPAGATGADWPVVVVGDPDDAYVGPSTNEHVVGDKHVLLSGTVDGSEFSFVGYQSSEGAGKGTSSCLQMAGPAIPGATLESPGPYPPGIDATTGGVGGYCIPSTAIEVEMRWPLFPAGTDLFMRTTAGGSGGVCDNCQAGEKRWVVVTGFVTGRVARLEVHLEDGSMRDVPVETWPNDDGVGAFIFFPPTAYLVGDVLAYDGDGRLLARAPLCGPADGDGGCDVSATEQIVPVAGTTTDAQQNFTIDFPSDWSPALEILTPALTDPREIFALGTYPLRPGGPNCTHFPMNAIEDLGPTDALIWLTERHVSGNTSTPARPSTFETWKDIPGVDETAFCLSAPKNFEHHYGEFSDAGRVFGLYVAYGASVSPKTLSELWAILDGMSFTRG